MSKIIVREANFDDRDLRGIWQLQQHLFDRGKWCSFSEFIQISRHRWLENPARTSDHVFGWVLESSIDGIVGFVGLIPVRMEIGGREIVGAAGNGFCVMPAHRGQSLRLYKQIMDWGDKHFLLTTTANPMSGKLNSLFGMEKIPVMNFDRYFLWLIRPEVLVRRALDKAKWPIFSYLISLAPISWMFKVAALVAFRNNMRLRFPTGTLSVEVVREITEEFGQFWEYHKKEYGVTAIRDQKYLQWRYFGMPPFLGTNHMLACRVNGLLKGYIVVMEISSAETSCAPGRFRVVDIFYDLKMQEVFDALMNHAYEFAKAQGGTALEVASMSHEVMERLKTQRPYEKKSESWLYWYKASKEDMTEVCRTHAWWPSAADGDSNL